MKKQLAVILCFGIACSQLLAQELPLHFCFSSQLEQAPGGISLGSQTGSNQFSLSSSALPLTTWPNIRPREDLSTSWDVLRKALISGSSTSTENNSELNRIRKQRLLSGLGLAVSWAGTVAVDLFAEDGYQSTTVIPVVGPWITLARMASHNDPGWPGAKALLVVSGIAQTGLTAYFIISLTRHPKPKETKAVALSAGFNSVSLRIQF
jgi:hypothetical protein